MGKARSFSDAANDTVYQSETNSENYSMNQQNAYNLGSVHFTDQSGIGNFSQAGSDQRKASLQGALFLGNLGFDLQTALLDTGTETIDLNEDSAGVVLSVISTDRFVTLDSGTTGTLTTITGAQRPGQRLRLYNTTTNTITITHTVAATVNTIRTPDGTDLTFPGDGVLDLTWDITTAQWRVVGNVGGGSGTNLLPLDNVWTGSNTFNGSPFIINGAITTLASVTSTSITSPLIALGDAIGDDLQVTATATFNSPSTFDDSVTIDGSPFIVNGAITTLASVTSTSITSPLIVLGDASSDNIAFGGQVSTEIVIEEITVPGTPPANTVTLYGKDDGGTSSLFFKDDSGTEFNLNAAGGAGANTALSNLVSVAINTSLLPNADGTLNLGSAAFSWLDTFTERLRIETGGTSTSTANQIISDAGGMIFNTPAGDRYEFNISGSPNGIAIEEDRIEFLTSGRQHRIDATGTSINILSENTGDSVEIWTGTGRTNATIDINSTTTTFLTQTSDVQAVLIQLIQNNNTPADFRTIGNIDFMAENSASSNEIYARVSASSQDVTSGTEDGLLQLGVISGGTLVSGIDIEGSSSSGSNDALIGFFGETPVVQQSVASDTLANLYTALRNLGLIV
jgi:hypothetical protein